jgi:hypothetical protein
MSSPTGVEINIFCITLILFFWVFYGFRNIWSLPLRHGDSFFLGVEVSPGFYEGPGIPWLKSYHAMVIVLHFIWALALGTIIILRRWDMAPLWAGGGAMLHVIPLLAFAAWTRHKLGANPPVRAVAIQLKSRRLGDYISWPLEALMAAVVAFSWWLLLRHGGTHIAWRDPLLMTWWVLGYLPGKIITVRAGSPLPTERTEEHYQYQDAVRRNAIRVYSGTAWFVAAVLFGYALLHTWSPAKTVPLWQWLIVGVTMAFWGNYVIYIVRGQRQLADMGRDLRPSGSWATPFRRAAGMDSSLINPVMRSRSGLIWFAIWFGGILVFIFYSLR